MCHLASHSDVPAPVAAAARESLGAGVQVSGSLGAEVADAAREAFVHAMSRASIVTALVAALGAFIAWRYLPARAVDRHSEVDASAAVDPALATMSS